MSASVPRFLPDDDALTPYEILGVPQDADEKQIKSARRRILAENHPDRNPGDTAARARFESAATAAEVLLDPDKRTWLHIEMAQRLIRQVEADIAAEQAEAYEQQQRDRQEREHQERRQQQQRDRQEREYQERLQQRRQQQQREQQEREHQERLQRLQRERRLQPHWTRPIWDTLALIAWVAASGAIGWYGVKFLLNSGLL